MVKVRDKVSVNAIFQPNNPQKYKDERVYKIDTASVNASTSKEQVVKVNPRNSNIRSSIQSVCSSVILDTKVPTKRMDPNVTLITPTILSPQKKVPLNQVVPLQVTEDRGVLDLGTSSVVNVTKDQNHLGKDKSVGDEDKPPNKNRKRKNMKRIQSIPDDVPAKQRATGTNETQKSRESRPRKRSFDSSSRRRSPDSNPRKRSPDSISRKRSPDSNSRKRSPDSNSRKRSPDSISRKRSPDSNSRKRSPDSKSRCIPKSFESFSLRELDCAAVKTLCRTLPVPAEFFHVSLKYQHSFPLNHPLKLGNKCHFKVLHKRVKCIDDSVNEALNKNIDPHDADPTFVAKVMLLSTDNLARFYESTLNLAEELDGDNKVPFTKAIKFLVASLGEDKEFGIGGAWSPSLDGPDPESNPRVLINTAIRTCRSMTGVDLSKCSSWPRFLELHYYRPLQKVVKKNMDGEIVIDLDDEEPVEWREPQMETVVYFVPDIWNMMPTQEQWTQIKKGYQEQLSRILCPPPSVLTSVTKVSGTVPLSSKCSSKVSTVEDEEEDYDCDDVEDGKTSIEEDSEVQPTHFSRLDLTTMKIIDIKKELEMRSLSCRGVMDQLRTRLRTALEKEEADDKNKESPAMTKVSQTVKTPLQASLSNEEKNELKKLYSLSEEPEIVVHQNLKYRHMKMKTMSLHSLLSYYNVKLEENTFELAVFAKIFLDMLRRDAVFNIYKSIVMAAPDMELTEKEPNKKSKLTVTVSKRTVNKPLLFSCNLIDREKVNKISLDSLKSLIECLGICLSANQLNEVLSKFKDKSKFFHYRQLTDKEMTDTEILDMMNMEANEDLDYIKELALGNKALFQEESQNMGAMINDDEMESLRNELDRSERCRQALELKVAHMKKETKKNMDLSTSQTNEIAKLRNQTLEYREKYNSEKNRGERYKHDFEKMFQQLKDLDKMTGDVNKFVSNSVNKFIKHLSKDDPKDKSDKTCTKKANKSDKSWKRVNNIDTKKKNKEEIDNQYSDHLDDIVLEDSALEEPSDNGTSVMEESSIMDTEKPVIEQSFSDMDKVIMNESLTDRAIEAENETDAPMNDLKENSTEQNEKEIDYLYSDHLDDIVLEDSVFEESSDMEKDLMEESSIMDAKKDIMEEFLSAMVSDKSVMEESLSDKAKDKSVMEESLSDIAKDKSVMEESLSDIAKEKSVMEKYPSAQEAVDETDKSMNYTYNINLKENENGNHLYPHLDPYIVLEDCGLGEYSDMVTNEGRMEESPRMDSENNVVEEFLSDLDKSVMEESSDSLFDKNLMDHSLTDLVTDKCVMEETLIEENKYSEENTLDLAESVTESRESISIPEDLGISSSVLM